MGLLSPILRNASDGHLIWWRPGCDGPHQIATGQGSGPRWGWSDGANPAMACRRVLKSGPKAAFSWRIREPGSEGYDARVATYTDPTDLKRQEHDAEAEEAGARERRRRELEDLRWLLAHPPGRRIVTRMLELTGVNRSSYAHSGSLMAFNEGRRDVGLFLTAEVLEASPEGYFKLLKEFKAKDD